MDGVIGLSGVDEFGVVVIDIEQFNNNLCCGSKSFRRAGILCSDEELVDGIDFPIKAHFGGDLSSRRINRESTLNCCL